MTEKPKRLWHIRIHRRCSYNGRYDRTDWRAYREWLVWPKTFPTQAEAQQFLERCFTFRGISGHKLSASTYECGSHAAMMRRGMLA